MKRTLSLLITFTCATPVLCGEDAAHTGDPVEKHAAPRYELKRRSTFTIAEDARSIFWPIGWVKREPGAPALAPTVPKFVLDAKNFSVTSILLGPPALAVINGRAYEEGQFLRTTRATTPGVPVAVAPAPAAGGAMPTGLRVRVQRISDGHVSLQADGQVVSIALKRPELSERKVEDELLNSERDELDLVPTVSARLPK